jgi:hypothetical protein
MNSPVNHRVLWLTTFFALLVAVLDSAGLLLATP